MAAIDRLKRLANRDSAEPGVYVCRGCEASFDVQYHVCPACGGYSVDRRCDDGDDADGAA